MSAAREERAQQHDAVARSDDRVAGTLGMGHESHHVAGFVGDPGDVVEASIGVVDVAQDHAVFVAEPTQCLGIAHVVAFEMVDRHPQHGAGRRQPGEHRRDVSTRSSTVSHRNVRPDVLLQRAGQQPGLGEHLEAVADADDRTTGRREVGRRRSSPARTARSRRSAGSRRARTRRARRRRRRRARCRRRARASPPRPPSCSTAQATSSSQLVPGNRTIPTFALMLVTAP